MTIDLESLHHEFMRDYARFQKLARYVEASICEQGPRFALLPVVQSRAKEWPNFARKAIRKNIQDPVKYADPLISIRDRAGARVLVSTLDEARRATALLEHLFVAVEPPEDARDRLDVDQLGYLGIHFQGRPRTTYLATDTLDLEGLDFEVQVHTYAQHAWSEVSHKLLYKPAGGSPSAAPARRVTRAIALAELFDDEIESARREIAAAEGYIAAAMLDVLQKHFLQLARRDFDAELTLEVLEVLRATYDDGELAAFGALMDQFVDAKRDQLRMIFERYADDPRVAPLLYQPEALAIFERLTSRPTTLEQVWFRAEALPDPTLQQLRDVFVA